jgi:biotin carboxyl carrier protein
VHIDEIAIRSWLALQCRMIPGVARARAAVRPDATGAFAARACWPDDEADTPELADACAAATQAATIVVREAGGPQGGPVVIAAPIRVSGRPVGVVAVEIPSLERGHRASVLRLFDWGSAWFALLLGGPQSVLAERLATVVGATAASLDHAPLRAAAAAAAISVARSLGCERVSIGLARDARARLLATSHGTSFESRAALTRDLEGAMDEAIEARAAVAHPPRPAAPSRVGGAQETLAMGQGSSAVCSVPLVSGARAVGAMTLERTRGAPFDDDDLELATAVADLLGPVLELKRREARTILARLREALQAVSASLVSGEHPSRKLGALAGLALVGWLALAGGEHRVTAQATLEGEVHQVLAAPIAGFVREAHARAGDRVAAGAFVAALDDKDLRLERRRWATERAELSKQHRRAIGKLERAQAKILEAQIGQVEARIALVDAQLERTRIVAPFDGVLVSGDLSHAIGAPVERGQVLFELAPLGGYRVALSVDEHDVAMLGSGQRGRLTLTALPGLPLDFVVERVVGPAEPGDGRSRFRLEGRLEGELAGIRPGMQGVAKIIVGERPLLWVWTHGLVDRARLWLWSVLP